MTTETDCDPPVCECADWHCQEPLGMTWEEFRVLAKTKNELLAPTCRTRKERAARREKD